MFKYECWFSSTFTKIPGIAAKVDDSALQNGDSVCRKDIGETKKLGQWSRGYQVIVGGGRNIEMFAPLYK